MIKHWNIFYNKIKYNSTVVIIYQINEDCKMNILIIVSYVENSDKQFALKLANKSEYIICADAGQFIAAKYEIKPNLCVGDFDSTDIINMDNDNPNNIKNYKLFDCEDVTYPAKKNLTDMEAAIEEAISRFPIDKLNISILGGIGGRLDHTIGAINTMRKYSDKRVQIRLIDMKNSAWFISSEIINSISIMKSKYYKYFSVIPYTYDVKGLTIKGAKYNLNDYNMKRLGSLGISNEIAEDSNFAMISLQKGDLLIIRSTD